MSFQMGAKRRLHTYEEVRQMERRWNRCYRVRTYLSAIAIIVNQILNAIGFKEFTGEQISIAVDVVLGILAFIFRMLAKPKS